MNGPVTMVTLNMYNKYIHRQFSHEKYISLHQLLQSRDTENKNLIRKMIDLMLIRLSDPRSRRFYSEPSTILLMHVP